MACSSIYFETWLDLSETLPRYYPLSQEIVNALMSAKEVRLVYHLQTSINREIEYTKKDLDEVREMMPCKFSEHDQYWKPVDKGSD